MTKEEKEEFQELKNQLEALRVRVGQLEDTPQMIHIPASPPVDLSPVIDVPSYWVGPNTTEPSDGGIASSEQRDYRVGDVPEQNPNPFSSLEGIGWS
jgi:hypothetical protein